MEENQVEEKKGWSWLGFFFAPGYGNVKKGAIYAIIGAFPLFSLIIGVISGRNARKELPIGKQDFNWKNVALTVFLTIASGLTMQTLISGGNINTVKDGTLNFDTSITVVEAFDNYKYFRKTKWEEFETDNKRSVVQVDGYFTQEYLNLIKRDKKFTFAKLIIQFKINKNDTFEIAAIGFELTRTNGKTEKIDAGKDMNNRQLNNMLQEIYNNKPMS
jgi:hypothetical protein